MVADNQGMTVTGQAGVPGSVLSLFLDARLPQRDAVARAWARRAEAAPWPGIETDPDYRRQLGNAIEIRIGLDVAAAPGYWDVLSFLPPEECRALLSSAGYSADGPSSGARSAQRSTTSSVPACATVIRYWQARSRPAISRAERYVPRGSAQCMLGLVFHCAARR